MLWFKNNGARIDMKRFYFFMMTTGEDRNKHLFTNWQLCGVWKLPFCDNRAIKFTPNCICFINLSINIRVLSFAGLPNANRPLAQMTVLQFPLLFLLFLTLIKDNSMSFILKLFRNYINRAKVLAAKFRGRQICHVWSFIQFRKHSHHGSLIVSRSTYGRCCTSPRLRVAHWLMVECNDTKLWLHQRILSNNLNINNIL